MTGSSRSGAWPVASALTPIAPWHRIEEIATVLWSSGFGWWVDAMGLGACVSQRCRLVCSAGVRDYPTTSTWITYPGTSGRGAGAT